METFIKKNSSRFPDQLLREAQGLKELEKRADSLCVPRVFEVDEKRLVTQKVAALPFTEDGHKKLGIGLARLHKKIHQSFGHENDNYIGLNPQINGKDENWGRFFLQKRLFAQVDLIQDHKLQESFRSILEKQSGAIVDFLNNHSPSPSPLHGDLWSGNALFDGKNAWLIDPAFYFGDREVDLAMTGMFGGFSQAFYNAYNGEFPQAPGHQQRKVVYNLYHYLNHFNLFGTGYLNGVKSGFTLVEGLKISQKPR